VPAWEQSAGRVPQVARPDAGRALPLALLVGLLVTFAVGSVLRDGHPEQVPLLDIGVFNAIYLLAALLCARPGIGHRATAGAWRLVTAALLATTAANVTFSLGASGAASPTVTTALADALYLAVYPATFAAVVLAVRASVPHFPASLWWDGVVTGLGAAAGLAGLAADRWSSIASVPDSVWTALVFPVCDIAMLSLLAGSVAVLREHVGRVLALGGAGVAAIAVSDLIYAVQTLRGGYAEGGLSDVVDVGGVALLAVGAWAGERPAPRRGGLGQVRWPVLALPSAAVVGSLLVLLLPTLGGGPARGLAVACILTAVARMYLTLREIRALGDAHRQARTDDLTGLANRRAFLARCDVLLPTATADAPLALLLLDVDRFKQINDSLGHGAGDTLLVQLADRLSAAVPARAVVARLAGDEFAVALDGIGEGEALAVAQEVHRAVEREFDLDGVPVRASTSIGVACAPQAATTRRELLRCADLAMYRAKAGDGRPQAYSAAPAADSLTWLPVAGMLRRALEAGGSGDHAGGAARDVVDVAGRLVVHLQPQVHLQTGAVVGAEALVRWEHPDRGLLPPETFLGVARAAGLMGPLTAAVLDLSLAACRRCWDQGHQVPVSVNVPAASLHDQDLPAKVRAALDRHGLSARALVLELTEETLMTHPDRACAVLGALRRDGVRVSIDDYGTGYSSLAYLRQLPVDELKLDRVFTQDLADDAAAGAVVRHTVDLAHALGLQLVVEGIEDQATLAAVRRLDGDVAQGYHVARPMPVGDLLRWLADRSPAATPPGAPVAQAGAIRTWTSAGGAA